MEEKPPSTPPIKVPPPMWENIPVPPIPPASVEVAAVEEPETPFYVPARPEPETPAVEVEHVPVLEPAEQERIPVNADFAAHLATYLRVETHEQQEYEAYHVETVLPDGRYTLLIDSGAVGNLCGDQWAIEVANRAKARSQNGYDGRAHFWFQVLAKGHMHALITVFFLCPCMPKKEMTFVAGLCVQPSRTPASQVCWGWSLCVRIGVYWTS
jgi:hypothetical protein